MKAAVRRTDFARLEMGALVALLCLASCPPKGARQTPDADAVAQELDAREQGATVIDAGPGEASPARVASQPDLIVGSVRGLEAWRYDGTGKRLVSAGFALSPRWLDEASIAAIVPRDALNPDDLSKGGSLDRISLLDGNRRRLAALPPFACKRSSELPPDKQPQLLGLGIQDPTNFIIDKAGRRACLTLMDRNQNMASVWLEVVVDLRKGSVRRWLIDSADACPPPAGVKVAEIADVPNCVGVDRSPRPARIRQPFPFEFTKAGILKRRGSPGTAVLRMAGYEADTLPGASPSGRWMLLRGDVEEADYIHARLVLLDQEKGEVFPISGGRAWPAPLRAEGKQKVPHIKTPREDTVPVVGETDVRWLGTSAESEQLIVGDLVVRPGQFAFHVEGEVAR